MKMVLLILALFASRAYSAEPQSIFNIEFSSPKIPAIVSPPLHWHFFTGNFSGSYKKKIRQAMKDIGAIEDPSGNISIGRIGPGETYFRLFPKTDGYVFCITEFDGTLINATLVMHCRVKARYAYALSRELASRLLDGR